jgi:hypothetical protein
MTQDRDFISKIVECPNGHRIRVETLSGTPDTTQSIKCPTCETPIVVFGGDIRGVVPVDGSSKTGSY